MLMAALGRGRLRVLEASGTTCSLSTGSSLIKLLIGRQVVSATEKLAVPSYFCPRVRVSVPNAREPSI